MNVFAPGCRHRTEANVTKIRHIYVEFDSGGATALQGLRARTDLPPASYVIHSSPGKFQVVWNVYGFTAVDAKRLLRHLAYTLGADTAVHDINRVLRLPGFRNYKYQPAPFVRLEAGRDLTRLSSARFPQPQTETRSITRSNGVPRSRLPGTQLAPSRSERDWAHVRQRLSAGDDWRAVFDELRDARTDKPNPRFYAALTVLKALNSVGRPDPPELVNELDAARGMRTGT
jgi:hypothetical protein